MSSLNGVKVLDLTRLLPGPYCTMLMGDMGAEVIKLEEPRLGDYARELLPGMYYAVNRNKKSVGVDLKHERGRDIFYRLAATADVVVEGFRPGVVDRLGVGYEDVKRLNPDIIYCSISGFGQTGPNRLRSGHDINYVALSGAASIPAAVGERPSGSGLPVTDLCAGMFAVMTITAALLARSKGKGGQYLDVSVTDAIFSWVSTRGGDYAMTGVELPPEKMKNLNPTNDIFDTADGRQISIGVVEEQFWQAFCKASGHEELLVHEQFSTYDLRRQHGVELKTIMHKIFTERTLPQWITLLESAGVPCARVNTVAEAYGDQQFQARQMVSEMFVPQLGRNIKQVAFPVKMSGTPSEMVLPPPALGQHTDSVLAAYGFSAADLADLRQSCVIT